MRLGKYETHQTHIFRGFASVLRHRLNFFFPSSNFTFSCTCDSSNFRRIFILCVLKRHCLRIFLKLELPGPPENPPHSQELMHTLLVLKSSSFVHLPSFPIDSSFFLVTILINKTSERLKKPHLVRLFSASQIYPDELFV